MIYDGLLDEVLATLAYGVLGVGLLALGFLVVDVLTPGRLGHVIWTEDGRGGAIVLAAKLLGIGAIVTTAIATSSDDLAEGLLGTAVFALVGLALSVVAFFILDWITPGRLGETLLSGGSTPHASCWVVAATDLATAAIVSAAVA
ncbi:DUF350 domain-containing protein [Actinocorallia sp. B10E7]|uniref:DUF350 domain-containing protein n=1 Tax=Actinocorallia sp. B10E7 TaxID=3153558 RepID=UPI00325EEA8D